MGDEGSRRLNNNTGRVRYISSKTKAAGSGIQTSNGISTRPGIMSDGPLDRAYTTGSDPGCASGNTANCKPNNINQGPGATGRQSWRQLR